MNKNLNYEFFNKGFFKINNLISKKKLNIVKNEIFDFANLFAKKINNFKFKKKILSLNDFSDFCINLESYNPKYFFHFVTLVSKLNSMLDLVNSISKSKLLNITSSILNEKKSNLLTSYPPSFLVNLPKNKRVLYHWHTAKSGYPKRVSYVNFWVPLLVEKKINNGSLKVAVKSHFNEDYPYKEFRDTDRFGKNALTQMLVPKSYVNKFVIKTLKGKVGSCYGMHRNLLHSSSLNKSNQCSYVLIFKIWSISKDLTLSSNIQQKLSEIDDGSCGEILSI